MFARFRASPSIVCSPHSLVREVEGVKQVRYETRLSGRSTAPWCMHVCAPHFSLLRLDPTIDHQTGPSVHEESEGTPSTSSPRGHLDPMHCTRYGEQAAGAPFPTLAGGARRGETSADDGEGVVRSAASSAAWSFDEVGCLCALLLAAGRDVFRGYGAGEGPGLPGRGGVTVKYQVCLVTGKEAQDLALGRERRIGLEGLCRVIVS